MVNTFKNAIAVYVILLSPLSLLCAPPAEAALLKPLELSDAVELALSNSPALSSAQKNNSIAALQKRSAFSNLLPSLDFSTTNGLQNNIPISALNNSQAILASNPTSPWTSSMRLGLTENLYDNGVTLTNLDIANLNKELSAVQMLKIRDGIVLDVVKAFYNFSLSNTLLSVRKEQQALLDRQFKILSGQYHQGFKAKSDFLRLKIQVRQAEIDRISAETGLNLTIVTLRNLLSIGASATEIPDFVPVAVSRDRKLIDRFPQTAPPLDDFYDFRISRLQKRVNDKSVDFAVRKYWPQVLLTAGATYGAQNYINSASNFSDDNQLSWNALVTLNYNLWDWGTRKRDVAVAEFNRDIQKNTIDQSLLTVNTTVQTLMSNIRRVDRSFNLNQELLGLQEESNREIEDQYRSGKLTYLDLITALNSLLAARIQFYSAYFDALSNLAEYRYFEGKIYDRSLQK